MVQVYRVSHEEVYDFNVLSFLNPKWIIYTVCDFFLSGYLVEQVQTLSFNNDANLKFVDDFFWYHIVSFHERSSNTLGVVINVWLWMGFILNSLVL